MKHNQAGREVCTIGMADHNQSSRAEPVSFGNGADELREFFRSGADIRQTWLCEPSEGRKHAILQNLASSPRRAAPGKVDSQDKGASSRHHRGHAMAHASRDSPESR